MRGRKEINLELLAAISVDHAKVVVHRLQLEVLLDIRDLLSQEKTAGSAGSTSIIDGVNRGT